MLLVSNCSLMLANGKPSQRADESPPLMEHHLQLTGRRQPFGMLPHQVEMHEKLPLPWSVIWQVKSFA